MHVKIKNNKEEKLDVLIEGNEDSEVTIVFVHGFGVDKHETAGFFDDIADALKDKFRVVRFDFSGCGKSEGKSEDMDYKKQAKDLDTVLEYVKKEYQEKICILAQSMGTFVTALLSPNGIKKTIFIGIPNNNTDYMIKRLVDRFTSRTGGKFDEKGISLMPRSTGIIQKIGPSFWSVLRSFKPAEAVEKYSKKTNLIIFKPKQDEVVGDKFMDNYKKIKTLKYIELDGDHSWKNKLLRKLLIKRILSFLRSS